MGEVDVYLTDEFEQFSKNMNDLHTVRKQKQEEAKKVLTDIHAIDQQASSLKAKWEEFVEKSKEAAKKGK